MKRLSIIIYSLCLVCMLAVNPTHAQDSASIIGTVRHCSQQESYGGEVVREREYWQFEANDATVSETYGIETYLGTKIASRTLVDYGRGAVFYQQGDTQFFYALDDMTVDITCLATLHKEFLVDESVNKLETLTSAVDVIATNVEVDGISYPIQLLLAPSFIGKFPMLVDVPLMPFDGRGFSQSIDFDLLPSDFVPLDGRLTLDLIDRLATFYVEQLQGWEIASPELTNFSNNPELLPGDHQAYLTFVNPETEATVDLYFNVPRRENRLEVVVSVPESTVKTQSESVIEGSSQSLATLNTFFSGWGNPQPYTTYLDGRVAVYVLQRDNQYWFVDLEIENNTFEVLFNEVVTQSDFDVNKFLPEWVRSP